MRCYCSLRASMFGGNTQTSLVFLLHCLKTNLKLIVVAAHSLSYIHYFKSTLMLTSELLKTGWDMQARGVLLFLKSWVYTFTCGS